MTVLMSEPTELHLGLMSILWRVLFVLDGMAAGNRCAALVGDVGISMAWRSTPRDPMFAKRVCLEMASAKWQGAF